MTRQRLDLRDEDLALLARALDADVDELRQDAAGRPWRLSDVLRRPEVVEMVSGDGADEEFVISPLLYFAVLVHRAADELVTSDWVDEWVGPGRRLPVFDVEPLLEFTDAPGRLQFTTKLLVGFAAPTNDHLPCEVSDIDGLVDWLEVVEPADRIGLLRHLGDLALFQAGVFPDSSGASMLSAERAEHLGRSVHMTDDELDHLVDHGSCTPGLDALETLSSAWYRAAAQDSPSMPVLLHDVAHRIRAARRFLNYLADQYLYRFQTHWAIADWDAPAG